MNTGKNIFMGAFCLLTAILFWGQLQRFPAVKSVQWDREESKKILYSKFSVDSARHGRLYFEPKDMRNIEIRTGVSVVLDPAFEGIEVSGDTAFVKNIVLEQYHETNYYLRSVFGETNESGASTKEEALFLASDVRIRVGAGPELKYISFFGRRLQTLGPIRREELVLTISGAVAQLELDVNRFQMHIFNSNPPDSTRTRVLLRGNANILHMYDIEDATVDAKALRVRDCYLSSAVNSNLILNDPELLNAGVLKGARLELINRPRYRRIDALERDEKSGRMSEVIEY
jgi:hypothetical protein